MCGQTLQNPFHHGAAYWCQDARENRSELIESEVDTYAGTDGTHILIERPIKIHEPKFRKDYKEIIHEFVQVHRYNTRSPKLGLWRLVLFCHNLRDLKQS